MATIAEQLALLGADKERLARSVMRRPVVVPELLQGLGSETTRIKFGCAKVLRLISAQEPEVLYPHFAAFAKLLDHENKILQWEAIHVLSDLVRVDSSNKFAALFDRYFRPITGPVMITAANVIGGAAKIARARPEWADRIAAEILKVRRARYQTDECRNVAIGHAVKALGEVYPLLKNPKPVRRFVSAQRQNSRPATRKKAEWFARRFAPRQRAASP